MTEKITAKLDLRELTGKKVAKLRENGIVPGTVYGDGEESNVQLLQQDAQRLVNKAGKHSTIELSLNGKKKMALIKTVDYAPASSYITHIGFQAVSANEVITTEIPVVITDPDQSPAVKAGYIIEQAIEQVELRVKAGELPENITIATGSLAKPGDKLTLAAAKLPKSAELVGLDADDAVAIVRDPAATEEADATDTTTADAANVPSEQKSDNE